MLQKIVNSGEMSASREASVDEEVEEVQAHLPVDAIRLRRPDSMAIDGGAQTRVSGSRVRGEKQRGRGEKYLGERGEGARGAASCTRGRGRGERVERGRARERARSLQRKVEDDREDFPENPLKLSFPFIQVLFSYSFLISVFLFKYCRKPLI